MNIIEDTENEDEGLAALVIIDRSALSGVIHIEYSVVALVLIPPVRQTVAVLVDIDSIHQRIAIHVDVPVIIAIPRTPAHQYMPVHLRNLTVGHRQRRVVETVVGIDESLVNRERIEEPEHLPMCALHHSPESTVIRAVDYITVAVGIAIPPSKLIGRV